MSDYYLIDSPVNIFSTTKEVKSWIKKLKSKEFPQDNSQVRNAIKQAEQLLKVA